MVWFVANKARGTEEIFAERGPLIGMVKLIPDGFHKRIAADFFVLGNEGRTV